MEELIKAFHLDGKILVAQLVNFSIVFFLFYKLVYFPILKKMNERTQKIEKGLADAAKASQILDESNQEREKRILSAKKEAGEILEKSRLLAEKNRKSLAEKAQIESSKIVQEAKKQITVEKEKALNEIKGEIVTLLELSLTKILKEKNLSQQDSELIKKSVEEINQKMG